MDLKNNPEINRVMKYRILGLEIVLSDDNYEIVMQWLRLIKVNYFKSKKVEYGMCQVVRQILFKGKTDQVTVGNRKFDTNFDDLESFTSCMDDIADHLIAKDIQYSITTKINLDNKRLPEHRKIKVEPDHSSSSRESHSSLDAANSDASDSSVKQEDQENEQKGGNVCGLYDTLCKIVSDKRMYPPQSNDED